MIEQLKSGLRQEISDYVIHEIQRNDDRSVVSQPSKTYIVTSHWIDKLTLGMNDKYQKIIQLERKDHRAERNPFRNLIAQEISMVLEQMGYALEGGFYVKETDEWSKAKQTIREQISEKLDVLIQETGYYIPRGLTIRNIHSSLKEEYEKYFDNPTGLLELVRVEVSDLMDQKGYTPMFIFVKRG